jgi:hypothetical protein
MKYTKSTTSVSGAWVRASEIKSGTRAKITTETKPIESNFTDKDGKAKMQDVCKIRFEGKDEEFNVSINRATRDALIDAFGDDSIEWVGKILTATTEKMVVGGKRVTALYLVPEGYALSEDNNGYMVITKNGVSPTYPDIDSEEVANLIPF